jgi:DNA-binding beta-propeller fold protein YncE
MTWHDGRIYVADAINNRIQVLSDTGEFITTLGRPGAPLPLHYPYDITMGTDGALYVVEYGAGRVTKVGLDGRLLGRFGSTGRGEGQFHTPWGIAIDSQLRIRVADTGNRRIVELKL